MVVGIDVSCKIKIFLTAKRAHHIFVDMLQSNTPFLYQYPVSTHRGFNNDSGTVFKNCGMSQYKGAPKIDKTAAPEPMYENAAAESHELAAINNDVDVVKLTAGTQEDVSSPSTSRRLRVPRPARASQQRTHIIV